MKRYEHKVVWAGTPGDVMDDALTTRLEHYAADGWELVQYVGDAYRGNGLLFLKRPVAETGA